jgi:hypothetical protein
MKTVATNPDPPVSAGQRAYETWIRLHGMRPTPWENLSAQTRKVWTEVARAARSV